jgi:sugar phosphate isomerase/epimerase
VEPAKPALRREQANSFSGPKAVLCNRDTGDVRAVIETASADGWDGVEWAAHDGFATAVSLLDRLATAYANTANACCAVAFSLQTSRLEQAIHETTEILDRCAAVGATCLNLTVPPLRPFEPDKSEADAFTRYQDQLNFAFLLLHRARFSAERTGVPLALEAAAGGGLRSPVELREIIDEANSATIGACLDAARLATLGSPADWVETLGPRVHALRLTGPDFDPPLVDALTRRAFDRTMIVDQPNLHVARRLFAETG